VNISQLKTSNGNELSTQNFNHKKTLASICFFLGKGDSVSERMPLQQHLRVEGKRLNSVLKADNLKRPTKEPKNIKVITETSINTLRYNG